MANDHSSDNTRPDIESGASDDQPERTDDHLPALSRRKVQDVLARLCLSDPASDSTSAAVILGSGVLGALFTSFAALSSRYWDQFIGFPSDVPSELIVIEFILLLITASFGIGLVKVSRRFQNGTGQAAALVGAISISLLVIFGGFSLDFLYYDPVLTISFVAYLTRPRDRGRGVGQEQHRNWLHRLFSVGNSEHVILISVGTSVTFFIAIYILMRLNNPAVAQIYLDPRSYLGDVSYFGSLIIIVELVILGKWVTSYAGIWDEAEACFGTDENPRSYEEFLTAQLKWMYAPWPVFFGFILLWFYVWLPVYFRNYIPEISFTAIIMFLGIPIIYMFIIHVLTVRKALKFNLENIHIAAQKLEPITQFTVNIAFWWFVAISVFGIIVFFNVPSPDIHNLVEPIVIWLGPLIAIGFALVALPTWQIHVALRAAKNDLLTDVNAKHDEAINKWMTTDTTTDEVANELDAAERAHQSVTRVRTWPYDVTGLVKVLISSVIPITQFVLSIFRYLTELVGG